MTSDARRIGLYLALGGLMVVLDTTVAVVAVPALIAEFDAGLATVQWVTTGYALALVGIMPTAAFLVGRLGGRRTYLTALAVFTAASLLAGLSWSVASLIGFRVLQGLGGGLLNPVGMAIALSAVPPERRGRMMSLVGLPVLIGPLIGPVLGGVLVDEVSWRWIFWINVPVGLAAIAAGRRLLPGGTGVGLLPATPAGVGPGEPATAGAGPGKPATAGAAPRPPDPTGAGTRLPLDVPGLLLLCPGVTLAVLGLTLAGETGNPLTPAALGPVLLGAAMVAGFVRRALRVPYPLLRIRVLRHRSMAAGAGTLALFAAAYFGSMVIAPVYVQIARGDGATLAGLIGIPQALATGLSLQVATRLTDRVPARLVVRTGVATALAGMLLLAVVLDAETPYPLFMAVGVVIGAGAGASILPTITAATLPVPAPEMPSATTVLNIFSQSAVAVGTAAVAAAVTLAGGGLTAGADLAGALRTALLVPIVLLAAALAVSTRLPRARRAGKEAAAVR
jgi:MFS family permease